MTDDDGYAGYVEWQKRKQQFAEDVIAKHGGIVNACRHYAKLMHEQCLPNVEAFLIPIILEQVALAHEAGLRINAAYADENARLNARINALASIDYRKPSEVQLLIGNPDYNKGVAAGMAWAAKLARGDTE